MPKPTVIDGAHAALFDEFVVYKRNLGYGYPEQTLQLIRYFSSFLAGFPSEETILTKELAETFCAPREGEAVSTRNKRFSVVRQFALFLQSKDIPCYVPPEHHDKASTEFVPYIITEEQMMDIIACADQQPFLPHASTTKAVYSMALRLLWCCGLRLSEALSLRLEDVDADVGVLIIRRAKYNQVRLIPLSDSLLEYLRAYWDEMGFAGKTPEAFFLPNHRGGRYVREAASTHIQTIMLRAGVTKDGAKPPRTHDLRHSFAVRALQKMADDGTDIYCALPMLSIFMGHSDIISTEYYLRLTGYAFPDVTGRMEKAYANVFPEVRQND